MPTSAHRSMLAAFAAALSAVLACAQADWRDTPGYLLDTYAGATMAYEPGNRLLRFGGATVVPIPPGTVGTAQLVSGNTTWLGN